MNISREFKEELTKDFGFITENLIEIPNKRSRIQSRTPSPIRISSAKLQLQKLKMSLDTDSRQKKVEDFRKKSLEQKKVLSKIPPPENSPKSSPDFCKALKKENLHIRTKGIRSEFPKQLLSDFPFLRSPNNKEDVLPLFKLYDESIKKCEGQKIINNIVFN